MVNGFFNMLFNMVENDYFFANIDIIYHIINIIDLIYITIPSIFAPSIKSKNN